MKLPTSCVPRAMARTIAKRLKARFGLDRTWRLELLNNRRLLNDAPTSKIRFLCGPWTATWMGGQWFVRLKDGGYCYSRTVRAAQRRILAEMEKKKAALLNAQYDMARECAQWLGK